MFKNTDFFMCVFSIDIDNFKPLKKTSNPKKSTDIKQNRKFNNRQTKKKTYISPKSETIPKNQLFLLQSWDSYIYF